MSEIKKSIVGEHSINTGVHTQFIIDLTNQGFNGGSICADLLGYSLASVTITTIGATGTSGTSAIAQSNNAVGPGTQVDDTGGTPVSLTVAANATVEAFSIPVSGRYLIVPTKTITFGTVGRVQIDIVAKR